MSDWKPGEWSDMTTRRRLLVAAFAVLVAVLFVLFNPDLVPFLWETQ
jgi:hypothetical protein